MNSKAKKWKPLYRFIRWCVRLFYPKIEVVGVENLPQEPCIVVGNHSQMHGPIVGELYFPGNRAIWCAGEMMHLKEVPAYAFRDFWSQKPKWTHWFYKALSYVIAPFSVCIFNNAATIGVYRDTRILTTFKNTVSALCDGKNVVIFPEKDEKYNHIVYEFQDRFVDVAQLYYKKTGKCLSFVPLYIAPKRKAMYLGQPVAYAPENGKEAERQRICAEMKARITDLAVSLPKHRVVPYRNIRKKDYPTNI